MSFKKEKNFDDKYFNDPSIKVLNLSINEKKQWEAIIKSIFDQNQTCQKLPNNQCYDQSFVHLCLKRDLKTNQIFLVSYYCPKKILQTNYLIREFASNNLSLSLYSKTSVSINNDEKHLNDYLIKSIENNSDIGLYFYGASGIGKTYKIISYCNDMILKNHKTISYIFLPQFVRMLKDNFSLDPFFNKKLINDSCKADILVLDDFGAEYATSWFYLNYLLVILNERCEHNKKTIFVSNFNFFDVQKILKKNLSSNYDKNSIDRINNDVNINRLFDRIKQLVNSKQFTYIAKSRRK